MTVTKIMRSKIYLNDRAHWRVESKPNEPTRSTGPAVHVFSFLFLLLSWLLASSVYNGGAEEGQPCATVRCKLECQQPVE